MISSEILDKLIPIPSKEQLMAEAAAQLAEMDFPITNFKPGGVFYTLLMIVFQIKIEFLTLFRVVLGNLWISHADDLWLDLAAANFGVRRKAPQRAEGIITLTRLSGGAAVRITKGHVFKTKMDNAGQELRFIVTEAAIFPAESTVCNVPVQAEKAGSLYNVPAGTVCNSLTHIESVEEITNGADWLTREGSDNEPLESFRGRAKNVWADLSALAIRQKYQNTCESVEGVLLARIDDEHPRGQGSVDCIITGAAGKATEALLSEVLSAVNKIKGPYDNVLVKSSETVKQDIVEVLQIPAKLSNEGLEDAAKTIAAKVLQVTKNRNLNELFVSDLIFQTRAGLPQLRNVRITTPAADVVLEKDKVVVLGTVTVTIERV